MSRSQSGKVTYSKSSNFEGPVGFSQFYGHVTPKTWFFPQERNFPFFLQIKFNLKNQECTRKTLTTKLPDK